MEAVLEMFPRLSKGDILYLSGSENSGNAKKVGRDTPDKA
jgi:hypothetical protein